MKRQQTQKFNENELKTIRVNLSYRKKIEQPLSKFVYSQTKTYEENIDRLCSIIQKALNIGQDLGLKFILAFKKYIKCEYNIPIQVNLKNLKYEQMLSLFQEWQISFKQNSCLEISQRLYTINHRNILFNRVFVQQKSNILQYFETLSDKKMLKPVDIYQLLVDILLHYYLYEYASDNQTFFDKINSFNNFLEMVEVFKHSSKRIVVDNKSKDFDFIKIYQFQALINFWQFINPQLQLRSDIRFSICSVQVQTQQNIVMSNKDCQTQTIDKSIDKYTLQQVINKSLKDLNRLTEDQNKLQTLQIIQNICETLRKQKIKLFQIGNSLRLTYQNSPISIGNVKLQQQNDLIIQDGQKSESQKTQKISMRNSRRYQQNMDKSFIKRKTDQKMIENMQSSIIINKFQKYQSFPQIYQKNQQKQKQKQRLNTYKNNNNQNPYFKKSRQKMQNNNKSKQKKMYHQNNILMQIQDNQNQYFPERQSTNLLLKLLQKIYSFYSDKQSGVMNMDRLNQFFTDIGIINQGQTSLSFKLIRRNKIQNVNVIKIFEFLQIMQQIKKQDKDLTFQVIQQFVNYEIQSKILQNQQKIYQQSLHKNKYSKSIIQNNSRNINREKSTEKQSRRYKYSQDNFQIQLNSLVKAKQRSSVPLLGINNRLGSDKKRNNF